MTKEQLPVAEFGSPDKPLRIGKLGIPCYVLSDGRRVLVQRGMLSALNMAPGTASLRGRGDRLAKFVGTRAIKPFVPNELMVMITNPIRFRVPSGGGSAYGYEATILPDLCDAVLEARKAGAIHRQQEHIAAQCEILVRAFAKVGIIALVDEATGYQEVRDRQALEKILELYISQELLRWAKTFPDQFYKELFRLRGWPYSPASIKRPQLVGKLTNDLVYQRLEVGVLDELRKRNPKDERGRRKHRHHQWLTEDVGHPRLREHLFAVIALMKASPTWDQFKRLMSRSLPKKKQLPLFEVEEAKVAP